MVGIVTERAVEWVCSLLRFWGNRNEYDMLLDLILIQYWESVGYGENGQESHCFVDSLRGIKRRPGQQV
jgi:hypothetical protein